MKVLAFDSCFGAVSAAVRWPTAGGEMIVREVYEERDSGHAERLLGLVDEVLGAAGLAFGDLDRIAVTLGPGSFTGVRTGLAAARGLALALDRPLVGASSLAVMARRASHLLGSRHANEVLAVIVDARRDGFYVALFGADGGSLGPPELLTLDGALEAIGGRRTTAVGSGAARLAALAGGHVAAMLDRLQPHARFLAMMAGDLTPLVPARPIYLRAVDARPQSAKTLLRAVT